jgi:hypothetical protein
MMQSHIMSNFCPFSSCCLQDNATTVHQVQACLVSRNNPYLVQIQSNKTHLVFALHHHPEHAQLYPKGTRQAPTPHPRISTTSTLQTHAHPIQCQSPEGGR